MISCGTLNNLECVLEYNNLILYKLVVLGLIFIYSLFVIYRYKGTDWLKIKNDKSNFDFLKDFMSYIMSSMYVYMIPFILLLLRPEVTFEMFLTYLVVGYIIFVVILFGLSVLFLEKFVTWFFTKQTISEVRERMKYGKK